MTTTNIKLADKMPNCTHFYEGLSQEEIDSVVVQKYYDSETGILGTIEALPKFAKNEHVSIGMTFG